MHQLTVESGPWHGEATHMKASQTEQRLLDLARAQKRNALQCRGSQELNTKNTG